MKPYTPVPRFYHERLTIAIMCNESLSLHWRDETRDQAYMAKVRPVELVTEAGRDYLLADDQQAGTPLKIRLDLIENMPTPVK